MCRLRPIGKPLSHISYIFIDLHNFDTIIFEQVACRLMPHVHITAYKYVLVADVAIFSVDIISIVSPHES